MADERRTDDRIEETDEELRPASSHGNKDELLVSASGRADIQGRLIAEDEDVGEYEGEHESLPADYQYRVSTAVSDRYGVYPAPGDDDLPLGMTTDRKLAAEEGLSYFPPEDPATMPADDVEQGQEIAAGYSASLRDAGYDHEELPDHVNNNDLDLAQDVAEAIRLTSILTGYRLTVTVEDAVVTVEGEVSQFEDLARLESVLMNVPGVEDVEMDDVDISDDIIEGMRRVRAPQIVADAKDEEVAKPGLDKLGGDY